MNDYMLVSVVISLLGAILFLYFRLRKIQYMLDNIIEEFPSRRTSLAAPLPTKPIAGLDSIKVMHPFDIMATKGLKAIPFLDSIVKKLHGLGYEEFLRTENVANRLLVGPDIYPRVYKIAETVRAVLGLQPIEIWLAPSSEVDAYTSGINNPWIVLNSGLIDTVDDSELAFIIGHEMGHILCEHVLYLSMADNFMRFTDAASEITPLRVAGAASTAIYPTLMEWRRQAELSADRVALLAVRDINVALRTMIMLAGGGVRGKNECDPKAILQQAGKYNQTKGLPGWIFRIASVYNSHPWPIVRAEHLAKWHASQEYAALINGAESGEAVA